MRLNPRFTLAVSNQMVGKCMIVVVVSLLDLTAQRTSSTGGLMCNLECLNSGISGGCSRLVAVELRCGRHSHDGPYFALCSGS
jgi:hypothetical protein